MNPQTIMIMIVISLYLFVILEAVVIFLWYGKNKYILNLYERKEGVFLKESKRWRVEKIVTYKKKQSWKDWFKKRVIDKTEYRFFKILDFMKRKDLGVDYDQVKSYEYILESMPFIGAKLGINILINNDGKNKQYIAWLPKYELTEDELIINTNIVWCSQARTELLEYTKPDEKKVDILMKILLPMGLIILAICILVFFPKIYEVVTQGGQAAVQTAVSNFNSIVEQMIPKG